MQQPKRQGAKRSADTPPLEAGAPAEGRNVRQRVAGGSSDVRLPRTVGVLELAEARVAEIARLGAALDARGGRQRVFQSLPRHLRRRAMSHNPYRVPSRLRDAHLRESEGNEAKPPARKSRKSKRRPQNALRWRERVQRAHVWLETHVWSAKRMFMEKRWGYVLARRPSQRSFKPLLLAAKNLCTVYDASFFGTLELRGEVDAVVALLAPLLVPGVPVEERLATPQLASGARRGEVLLYRPGEYPRGVLGPAEVLWSPVAAAGGGQAASAAAAAAKASPTRQLWITLHPALFPAVLGLLQQAKEATSAAVTINDLRNQFVRIELSGAQSSQVLQAMLRPAGDEGAANATFKSWLAQGTLGAPSAMPANAVLGLTVQSFLEFSTRQRFTKRRVNSTATPEVGAELALSPLWNKQKRDAEKAKGAQLATAKPKPRPLAASDRPPVQHTVSALVVQRPGDVVRCGWDVILPANWGKAAWIAAVHAGARPMGFDNRAHHSLEAGQLRFPEDFPDSRVAEQLRLREQAEERATYERRPPAKRVNFERLAVDYPFGPDWGALLGVECKVQVGDGPLPCLSPEEESLPFHVVRDRSGLRALLRGEGEPPAHAIVRVRLVVAKGTPEAGSMICAPTAEDVAQFRADAAALRVREPRRLRGPAAAPVSRELVGFVSSGGFSFLQGHVHAVGFASAPALQRVFQSARLDDGHALVLVRNRTSDLYRPMKVAVYQS